MPVSVSDRDTAVTLLEAIGNRRRTLREQEGALRTDTREALKATRGHVSRAEAARLTGLNRSTIYELYLGDEDGAAHGSAGPGERHSAESSGLEAADTSG